MTQPKDKYLEEIELYAHNDLQKTCRVFLDTGTLLWLWADLEENGLET